MKSTDPSLRPPLHGHDDGVCTSSCSWILLDMYPYIADRENSTSAEAKMNTGDKIRVTLCAAPPPLVSYVCVWCPGLPASEIEITNLEAAESDLLVVHVALKSRDAHSEFFVYKASASEGPLLRPLQVPRECLRMRYHIGLLAHSDVAGARPRGEDDDDDIQDGDGGGGGVRLLSHGEEGCGVGLRSHGGGGGDFSGIRSHGPGGGVRLHPYRDGDAIRFRPHDKGLDHYFVAALCFKSCTDETATFNLWVYNSTDEKWITSPFSLHGRPPPRQLTAKVIVLGQGGQLAFVDPWRGIVICDVLGCAPPSYLPVPEQIAWYGRCDEAQLARDVVLVDGRLALVNLCYLVEPGTCDADCSTWEVSAWSKGVFGEEEWCLDYEVQSRDILIDGDTENAGLLPRMMEDGGGSGGKLMRPTLEGIYIAHPMLSLTESHVVYIMAKVGRHDEKVLVLSVDMRKKRLRAVAMFDGERMRGMFSYTCTQSRIPGYFNTESKGNLKRPGNFNARYPCKLRDRINMMNDLSSGADEEQRDNIMDLD